MYNDFKVIVCTAAGRRRYMQYLVPPIINNSLVDRYDIWIHTNDNCDIEFFKALAKRYPKVNLLWQPRKKLESIRSIDDFYQFCQEEQTIYIKIDDDVVWTEDDFIDRMVKFRVDNPACFIVSPLVINNALSTYLLQQRGRLKTDNYYNSNAGHPILWRNGYFALALHNWFLNDYLKKGRVSLLHCGQCPMAMTRFSINCILFFGEDMKRIYEEFGGVTGDDEEFLSSKYPTIIGRANAINGDSIISHFAFFTQRAILDSENILEQYGEYLHKEWNKDEQLSVIDHEIQMILRDIESRKNELSCLKKPYVVVQVGRHSLSTRIVRRIFYPFRALICYYHERKAKRHKFEIC